MLAQTLAPIAAQALVGLSVWIPLFVSPAIAAAGSLLVAFIPETVHAGRQRGSKTEAPVFRPRLADRHRAGNAQG